LKLLKDRVSKMRKLAALAANPYRQDLEAQIATMQKQLFRASVQARSAVQAASQLERGMPTEQDVKLPLNCRWEQAQHQLQASNKMISEQQQQLAELKEKLTKERAAHAMTAERE
jgi:hypothetical protein